MAKRPPGQWVPLFELSRLLKVRREKLLELIEEGELAPAFDLRGKGSSRSAIRIPRAAVLEFLENRRGKDWRKFSGTVTAGMPRKVVSHGVRWAGSSRTHL
jgi:Helix-turn-helix domain